MGGRPSRLISDADITVIVAAATTRPEKLGLPFTQWSLRNLTAHLASRDVRIGRERLRQILHARKISFQRTRTWKESADPDRDAKLDRIEHVTSCFLDRCFAFDQFGPLSIRPAHGTCWARQNKPVRLPATYHRTHGIGYFHGCCSLGDDRLWGIIPTTPCWPAACRTISPGAPPVDLEQYHIRGQARAGGLINEYRLVA